MRLSIKKTVSKDYLIFSSIILAVTILYTALFALFTYENQIKNLNVKSQVKALQIKQELSNKINEVYRYAEFLGEKINEKIYLKRDEEIEQILKRKRALQLSPELDNAIQWSNFGFYKENKEVISSGSIALPNLNENIESFYDFKKSEQNPWEIIFHKPFQIGKYKKYYALPISIGIENSEGRYVGSLFSVIYFDKITEDILSIINDKDVYFEILTKDNISLSGLVLPKSDLSSKPKEIEFNYSERLYAYPFYIKVGYSKKEQLYGFYKSIFAQFAELVFLTIVTLYVMYLFHNRIISPVIQLSSFAKKIAEEKEVEIPENNYSEEFKNMEKALKYVESFKRQILHSNDELLKKTTELEEVRVYLERIIRSSQDSDDTKSRIIKEIRYGTQSSMKFITSSLEFLIKSFEGNSEIKLTSEKTLSLLKNICAEIESIRTFTTESLNESYLDIGEIIKQSITLNNKEIQRKNIIFSSEFAEDLGLLYADKTRLYQIINSLIHRSMDFLNEGNRLNIRCTKELDTEKGGDNFILVISDDGYGISESKREELSKNLNREFFEGIDLSSKSIKKLVELHFGKIEIKDEWKKGSTIILKIPYRNSNSSNSKEQRDNIVSISNWKNRK